MLINYDKPECQEVLKQLEILNCEVDKVVNKRTKFLDDNMHLFAEFQIGEKVFNKKNGDKTTVKEHYRYWAGRSSFYDSSFDVDCTFSNGDNTSRYAGLHPYVKQEE